MLKCSVTVGNGWCGVALTLQAGVKYLIGCGDLLPVDSEGQEAGGQVYQTADLQVHVAAAGAVSSGRHIATPHHVAVAPLDAAKTEALMRRRPSAAAQVKIAFFGKKNKKCKL